MFAGLVTLSAIAVIWFRLDAIAQSSLESSLTRVLGEPTEIASLSINKLTGAAQIKNLTIDNPEGYSDDHIFEVQAIDARFVPLSLFGQTLRLRSLTFDQIAVNFEQQLRDNNILDIVNHVKQRQSSRDSPHRQVAAQISFKGKRFEIETVDLNNILVNVNFSPLGNLIPFGGLSQAFQVQIPNIDLENVNSENAKFVLEGTLDDIVSGLLVNLSGGIFQEVPREMDSEEAKGLIGDIIKQLPF